MKTLLLTLTLSVLGLSFAGAAEWKTYLNKRFGYSLSYPAGATPGPVSENRAGRAFNTPDGEFSLQVHGWLRGDHTLDYYWKDSLAHYGKSITYKVKKKDWYVVSGVNKGGGEFYTKVILKGGNGVAFLVKYPHAKNKKYDSYVEKIAKSFKPFLKGDYDRAP